MLKHLRLRHIGLALIASAVLFTTACSKACSTPETKMSKIQATIAANPTDVSNLIAWQEGRIAHINERIRMVEQQNSSDPEEQALLIELRGELSQETGFLRSVQEMGNQPTAASSPNPSASPSSSPVAVVIGGAAGQAVFEKDWKLVFEYFPGTQARFQEIVNLDRQEELLFVDRHDPQLRPIWQDTRARVLALWGPFRDEMIQQLQILSTPRKVNVTMWGHIHDTDTVGDDEDCDYSDQARSTIRFGEMFPVSINPNCDNEVRLPVNAQVRLAIGPANSVILEITGRVQIYEDNEDKGSRNLFERLATGQESGEHRLEAEGLTDNGWVKFRYDALP